MSSEKQRLFRSFDSLGGAFSESTKKYPVREAGKDGDTGYEDYELEKLSEEDKIKYRNFPTYGLGDLKRGVEEDYEPSEEYLKHKNIEQFRLTGESEKFLNKVYDRASNPDKKKRLFSLNLDPTRYDGTIKERPMPERATGPKSEGKTESDPKLESFISKKILYWRKRLAGGKKEDIFDFRERPYQFIKQSYINRKIKLEQELGNLNLVTGKKAKEINRISDINGELRSINEELGLIEEVIRNKFPLPNDKYFDKEEIKFDKNIRPAIHKNSIVTIKNKKNSASFVILEINKGIVFFNDIKKRTKGKTKLNKLKKTLRNPENKILNVVKNSEKKSGTNDIKIKNTAPKKPEVSIPVHLKQILDIENQLEFPMNAALLGRELRISKEDAEKIFEEYQKSGISEWQKKKIESEPVDTSSNEKLVEINKKLDAIIQKRKSLNEKLEIIEGQIEKTKSKLYAEMVPKPEDTNKLIGYKPIEDKSEEQKIQPETTGIPKNINQAVGYDSVEEKVKDQVRKTDPRLRKALPASKASNNFIEEIPFEEVRDSRPIFEDMRVNPVHVEGPVGEFKPVELVRQREESAVIDKKNEEPDVKTKEPHYVKEFEGWKFKKRELNKEELRREITGFFDESPFIFNDKEYRIEDVRIKSIEDGFKIKANLDNRTISIELHDFSNSPNSLGVALDKTSVQRSIWSISGLFSSLSRSDTLVIAKGIAASFKKDFREYLEGRYGIKIERMKLENEKVVIYSRKEELPKSSVN
jgi:hypothetical protein